MKSNRKILALFLILTTILSSITVFYISAAQATDETYIDTLETENVVIEQELVPMMAMRCVGAYPDYPSNDGFLGDYEIVTLPAGTILWQYRRLDEINHSSRFYCMPGTPADVLALPPTQGSNYTCIVVTLTKPTIFHVGTVAPWGNCYNGWNSGGGIQYVIPG